MIKKLCDQFCNLFPHISIDQVWIIVKSKRGSEFQTWHRDFYLNDKITRTIVINLGAMKRSNVPGKAFGHLSDFPQEETTLEETLQVAAPSDLKSPPETLQVAAPSHLKSPPETSTTIREVQLAAPSDMKSLLLTSSTIREEQLAVPSDRKSPNKELVEFEYFNEREDSSEDKEDLGEYHTERETLERIRSPFNQESL